MPGMTIGRFAREAGVGTETVRYYQRRGLLPVPSTRSSAYLALTARSAAGTDPNGSEGQVKVIVGNDQVFHWKLVEIQKSLHRLSRKVHVGLRFGKDNLSRLMQPQM